MAYRVEKPRHHPDIPDEDLDPRVVAGLEYFKKLHEETKKPSSYGWDVLRPRMIRVLYDVYDLERPVEYA